MLVREIENGFDMAHTDIKKHSKVDGSLGFGYISISEHRIQRPQMATAAFTDRKEEF